MGASSTRLGLRSRSSFSGYVMSVAMTNCGAAGWITDRTGYRYDRIDPESDQPWPALPDCFLELAIAAATEAGYPHFVPDACLINRYDLAPVCRCIRTRTSAISRIRSCRCPLACRPSSSSVA
jgi:DNA oxidative demethylase